MPAVHERIHELHAELPEKSTEFYQELIAKSEHGHVLASIFEPSDQEHQASGTLDPSNETSFTVMRGLQHKYAPVALILASNQCYANCRFCFRKRVVSQASEEVAVDLEAIAEYIRSHQEIHTVLLTGGDSLCLDTERLRTIVDLLLPIEHVRTIRFGTRAPIVQPSRLDDPGLEKLFADIRRSGKVAAVIVHVVHFAEISQETRAHIRKLSAAGVRFYSQTVLLKGINDDPSVLATTFHDLHALGVQPYYLFQARPVQGTLHFQVPLERGCAITRAVNAKLAGTEKTYRYVMSHASGKLEILGMAEDSKLLLRYHASPHEEERGRLVTYHCPNGSSWVSGPVEPLST